MKINKQFQLILLVAFLVPLTRDIGTGVLVRLTPTSWDTYFPSLFSLMNYLIVVITLIITPLLVFASFYYIGKKPYLTFEMRPILLVVFIGKIISSVVGAMIYLVITRPLIPLIAISIPTIILHISQTILTYFVVDYLTALAGLSIGYFRQKKLTLTPEPEIS